MAGRAADEDFDGEEAEAEEGEGEGEEESEEVGGAEKGDEGAGLLVVGGEGGPPGGAGRRK